MIIHFILDSLCPFRLQDFWLERSFWSSLPACPWLSKNELGRLKDLDSLL